MKIEVKNKQISILGCGWLGLPLAKKLIQTGYAIKGSTTTEVKLSQLENENIVPFLIELKENTSDATIADFLSKSEILIINIPPKLRGENKENFVKKIENLIPFIEEAKIKKIVFVSSTSVFGNTSDTIIEVLTEETNPNPETESGKQLLETERILQANSNFKTTILRFGGLIGYDRHPVKHLAGRENLENPNGPINLIHQDDCIGIIESIIENNCFGEVFNAVAPFHPSRKEYYTQKAQEMSLALPLFASTILEKGKNISSAKLINILDYSFIKNNL